MEEVIEEIVNFWDWDTNANLVGGVVLVAGVCG